MTAAPASSAIWMQGTAGADAGVFGDCTSIILRDVQVGADEDALAFGFALGAQIGKADDVHGECVRGRRSRTF
jgi:hypothetical protein